MRIIKTSFVLYSAVLAFLLSLLTPSSIKAADFDIVCDDTSCSGLSGPVFSETGILPGDGVSKTISLQNDRGETLDISMELTKNPETDDAFAQIVETLIQLNSSDIYSGDLLGTMDTSYDLGSLSTGDSLITSLELFLPETAGNDYQESSTEFDISFVITGETGDTEVISTNTSNNSGSNDDNVNNDEQGSVLGDSDSEEEGVIGKILGMSNTSSGRRSILIMIGAVLLTLGAYLVTTSLINKNKSNL